MSSPRRQRTFFTFLAALALLTIETIALAHDVQHDLAQHDEPECALHLFVGGIDKLPKTNTAPPLPAATISVDPFFILPVRRVAPFTAYHGRAPPRTPVV